MDRSIAPCKRSGTLGLAAICRPVARHTGTIVGAVASCLRRLPRITAGPGTGAGWPARLCATSQASEVANGAGREISNIGDP